MIIPAAVFAACLFGILGAYWFFVLRLEQKELGIVRRRLSPKELVKASVARELVKQQQALSSIKAFDKVLRKSEKRTQGLKSLIEQSGVKITVGAIIAASALLAFVTFVLVAKLSGWVVLALPLAGLMAMIPVTVLKQLRTRRMRKFEDQFPEALDLIGRALRAGHAFTTGLKMAADELPQPVAAEFKLLYDQQNYGLPLPDALHAFAKRVPLIDARFFVTAVLTQRDAGGNLAEVLDNLSAVIRERFKIKRQLRVVSAHGRLTGLVLTILPPALALFLLVRMPEHFNILLEDPAGIRMIIVAVMLQLFGGYLIYRITKVEY